MEEVKMNRNDKAPHSSFFDRAYFVSRIWIFLLCGSIAFSLIKDVDGMITDTIDITISVILITLIYFLNKYFIKLKSDEELIKRSHLLDDSFGTKFSIEESNGYYDNKEMNLGIEKLLANVHESAYYTRNIVGEMFKRQIFIVIIWLFFILVFAVIGFKNIPFSIDLFDVFLSYVFIDKALDMYNLKKVSIQIVEDSCQYWGERDVDSQLDNKSIAKIIKIIINYETTLNSIEFILSSKVKNKLNEKLEEEWKSICKRYDIL